MRIAAVVGIALLVGACAKEPPRVAFDHANASQEQMLRDRLECLQQSPGFVRVEDRARAMPNSALYLSCMAVRGYSRNDGSGRLVVPTSLIARTY